MSEDLQSFIEPELEARLIAMILGEASAFESEELERLLAERPELVIWKRRMEAIHGLLGEAAKPPADDAAWKLSSERRAKVLKVLKTNRESVPEISSASSFQVQRRALLGIAAGVAVTAITGYSLFTSPKIAQIPKIITYSALPAVESEGGEILNELEVPHENPTHWDFVRRQDTVQEAESTLASGRDAYAKGNYREAVSKYRDALDLLPDGDASAKHRETITNHLNDGAVALAQENRRNGKFEEARSLLNEVQKRNPADMKIKKQLEYFDDPIRTNPALTYESTQNVDEVRRNLYKGEGFYNLGLYDKADEAFKDVLRTDPYNKAARRWMERTASIKSDYYNAAYDQTRAQMLMEVDRAWELAVPSAEGSAEQELAEATKEPRPKKAMASVAGKPSAPTSSMAKVVASSPASPTSLPVPDIEVPKPSVDFGDGDAFGSGWGAEKKKERIQKPSRQVRGLTKNKKMANTRTGGLSEDLSASSPSALDYFVSGNEGGKIDIPGIPDISQDEISNIVTAGNRSGEFEINRASIDAILNNPDRASEADGEVLVTRKFSIPPDFMSKLDGRNKGSDGYSVDDIGDPFADDSDHDVPKIAARKSIKELMMENGVVFPEGASAQYLASSGTLLVRSTEKNLEIIEALATDSAERDLDQFREILAKPGSVTHKLRNTILPEVNFKNVSVNEAIAQIQEQIKSQDTDAFNEHSGGVDIQLRHPRGEADHFSTDLDVDSLGSPGDVKIDSLFLKNVPAETALQYLADKAKLRYKIDDDGLSFLPLTATETDEIITRVWKVPPGLKSWLVNEGNQSNSSDPFQDETTESKLTDDASMQDVLENLGVSFPEGSSVQWLPNNKSLVMRGTPTNLELVAAIVDASLKEIEKKEAVKKLARDTFETATAQKPDSTFSLNVSDVSFKLAKSALAQGKWPEKEKVRVEEFVNAFDYLEASPSLSQKVACTIEQGAHPFMQQRNLLRVSMKTAALGRNATTPLRLTILLDRSGSMERRDRAESVVRAFSVLARQLNAADEVTLVAFDRRPRLLAERMKGDQGAALVKLIKQAPAEGGTNLEEALSHGYQYARQQFVEGAQNRIILLTDGAANLGNAAPEKLSHLVREMRREGIAFDACGVGSDDLNDQILESLAREGDGRYYLLNSPDDADAGFARQIAGALRPAAKNVKVQVIFNPERVGKYRLYGFEKHQLNKEDFRNDAVDAAEMSAEESGVAMYHYEPLPEGRGEIGTVAVRFQDTATGQMVERTWTIPYQPRVASFEKAKPTLRLAASAVLFGEKLKGSIMGERVELSKLIETVHGLRTTFNQQARYHELVKMLQQAK